MRLSVNLFVTFKLSGLFSSNESHGFNYWRHTFLHVQVKESDLPDNEWLYLYAEVVMFSKWETDLVSEDK